MSVQNLINELAKSPAPVNSQAVFAGAVKPVTGAAATNIFTSAAHGLAVDDVVRFTAITGGTGAAIDTNYWVITVPDANTFTLSATKGGSALDITADMTAGTAIKANLDTVDDSAVASQAAPTTVSENEGAVLVS